MRILHLTMSDIDGAGRAAQRLHQGLERLNHHNHTCINSQMLVQSKSSDDPTTVTTKNRFHLATNRLKLNERLDQFPLKLYRHRMQTTFSLQWVPAQLWRDIQAYDPDIINLHWVGHGFLPIELLKKFNKPLIWTLHDMWAFTGGCHYSQTCDRYQQQCGKCPQLNSHSEWDLSRWVWQRKAQNWRHLNLTVVTPSVWLKRCAIASSLFKQTPVEVIPNGIDTAVYKPIERQLARSILNLPIDRQLILFGASYANDPRKGFQCLKSALQRLSSQQHNQSVEVVIFGGSVPEVSTAIGLKVHSLGKLRDDTTLALAYAAADVFVVPSLQDNLPNTVMEALACGTPCVGFNIGGMPDMIEHQQNGYLAQPYETEDLAQGIAWVLEDQKRGDRLSQRARAKVEQAFTLQHQAAQYFELYQSLTNKTFHRID
jgi:glycosyltransferase involved in cell wall biosynthesis